MHVFFFGTSQGKEANRNNLQLAKPNMLLSIFTTLSFSIEVEPSQPSFVHGKVKIFRHCGAVLGLLSVQGEWAGWGFGHELNRKGHNATHV